MDALRVAAVNFAVAPAVDEAAHLDHIARLLDRAAGADLVVFPENLPLELLAMPGLDRATPREGAAALADWFAGRRDWFVGQAVGRGQTVLFGTQFVLEAGRLLNCAALATPDGALITDVPKVVLTQYERHGWGLSGGAGLRRLPDPRIGVTVCYDCEFPASGRALAEAGVLVQLVPAYTEGRQGFQRVRWCAQARAVENQVFVVHSSLVGGLGREPMPRGHGTSALLCPSVPPFPDSAVLAESGPEEGVAVADLDFEALAECRRSGDVRNWEDRDAGDWALRLPATSGR